VFVVLPPSLRAAVVLIVLGTASTTVACQSATLATDESENTPPDAGSPIDLNQVTGKDAGRRARAASDAALGSDPPDDAGAETAEVVGGTGLIEFATGVVSYSPGQCAGFGQTSMPDIVLGPPQGTGDVRGSLDVVSLGNGGEIVLSFEPAVIVDGPGTDFIVFENPFFIGGDPHNPYAEPGEVSVSDDGETWTPFPCTATAYPYGSCAGWHPVYASGPDFDPASAGGDAFDLAAVGVSRARFVRIRDKTAQRCTSQGPTTNGFDLDAIAVLNSGTP
jgi:hypothetical protein